MRIFLFILLWSLSLQSQAKGNLNVCVTDTLPAWCLGNWNNMHHQLWTYGLYEKFAIHEADFWTYGQIKPGKNNCIVTLTNGHRKVTLRLKRMKNGQMEIAKGKQKYNSYVLAAEGLPSYPGKDTSSFATIRYCPDTVILRGYFRNWEKLPQQQRNMPLEIYKNDFLKDSQLKFYSDVDTLGRFELKIAVDGLEELVVDWRFLRHKIYVQPKEKVFIFADALQLLEGTRQPTKEKYLNYVRHVQFMGDNARFHTEFAYCPTVNQRSDSESKMESDTELLASLQSDLSSFEQQFNSFRQQHPTLSRQTVSLVHMNALFEQGYILLQNQYNIRKQGRRSFEPAYEKYIRQNIPLNCEWYYLSNRLFRVFVRDLQNYDILQKAIYLPSSRSFFVPSEITHQMLFDQLRKEEDASAEELEKITRFEKFEALQNQLYQSGDTAALQKFLKEQETTASELLVFVHSERTRAIHDFLTLKKKAESIKHLFPSSYLQQLLTGSLFMKTFEEKRCPMDRRTEELANELIHSPEILNKIKTENQKYQELASQKFSWLESLKNTEHLKEYKDSKQLFQQLIAPYRGKVIYLDIWGTWCGPCRQQMQYVGAVKELFKGLPVVFMYLANRSDEKTWKNIIRQYNLTGEQVVHYRLPDEQEYQIERLLQIEGYPTFILLDQEGNIVNPNAPRPQSQEQLVKEIRALLK